MSISGSGAGIRDNHTPDHVPIDGPLHELLTQALDDGPAAPGTARPPLLRAALARWRGFRDAARRPTS
ncbi:hypothetical protein [Spirillospora sp. CA-294931]|uniref:hypothetical protein n=1 Tax=Spirillospora sp. CA-294931 TaxID=3240042 RepID=UPI003D8F8586